MEGIEPERFQVENVKEELRKKVLEIEERRSELQLQIQIAETEVKSAADPNRIAREKRASTKSIRRTAKRPVFLLTRDLSLEFKRQKQLSPLVRETIEAFCIIFGQKPHSVSMNPSGTKVDDYWPAMRSLMDDRMFIPKVLQYPVEKMSRETVDLLRKYVGADMQERDRKLKTIHSASTAAYRLHSWICAAYDYWFVYQEAAQKKREEEEAAGRLAAAEGILLARKAKLESVEAEMADLVDRINQGRETKGSVY
jgi:hypothetical protein